MNTPYFLSSYTRSYSNYQTREIIVSATRLPRSSIKRQYRRPGTKTLKLQNASPSDIDTANPCGQTASISKARQAKCKTHATSKKEQLESTITRFINTSENTQHVPPTNGMSGRGLTETNRSTKQQPLPTKSVYPKYQEEETNEPHESNETNKRIRRSGNENEQEAGSLVKKRKLKSETHKQPGDTSIQPGSVESSEQKFSPQQPNSLNLESNAPVIRSATPGPFVAQNENNSTIVEYNMPFNHEFGGNVNSNDSDERMRRINHIVRTGQHLHGGLLPLASWEFQDLQERLLEAREGTDNEKNKEGRKGE